VSGVLNSYKKGYKYITVVYDMDAGQVVWVHENQGYEVFKLFCEELTEEERANIGVIAGDGAKWIDQCKDEYFRNATRCMDPFHVCTWATEAVDRVRIDATRKAARECRAQETAFLKEEEQELGRLGLDSIMAYVAELDGQPEYDGMEPWKKVLFAGLMAYQQPLSKSPSGKKGKRRKKKLSPEHQAVPGQMEGNARTLKNSKHALGHAPENCTEKQTEKIQLIANSYPELYRAYQLKESLRLILHMKDYVLARDSLEKWIADAAASGIAPMAELSEKIGRHKENILNAIRCHANSARSEATNTTIKLLVRMARGFRNQDNLIALIYLKCSSLVIPLNNRWQVTCESAAV
jgi:transposase